MITECIDISYKDNPTTPEVTLVIVKDDVFFEDLPGTLPLTRDIQHTNESASGVSLLDLPHRRNDPTMLLNSKGKLICH